MISFLDEKTFIKIMTSDHALNLPSEKSGALAAFVTKSSLTYACKITGEPV
jgi:hypothetical protein